MPSPPPRAVSLSMSLSFFCLLVQFVHSIPHMSEIIWYLPFSDWLISLSIMFSRSIHTVTKGKIFFFFFYIRVIFHCVNAPHFLSTHLPMDTWLLPNLGDCKSCCNECREAYCLGNVFWTYSNKFSGVESLVLRQFHFNFLRNSIRLSTVAALVCISASSAKGFPSLHILTSSCCLFTY